MLKSIRTLRVGAIHSLMWLSFLWIGHPVHAPNTPEQRQQVSRGHVMLIALFWKILEIIHHFNTKVVGDRKPSVRLNEDSVMLMWVATNKVWLTGTERGCGLSLGHGDPDSDHYAKKAWEVGKHLETAQQLPCKRGGLGWWVCEA